MGAYPMFQDLLPLPEPSAPLILVPCPECDTEQPCNRCGQSRVIEVCSGCNEPYNVTCGQETCGCTFPYPLERHTTCELCGFDFPTSQMVDESVCNGCHIVGKEWLEAERVKHVSDAQEEIEWAIRAGLCTREQVES